jgi:chromosome partitioning protein
MRKLRQKSLTAATPQAHVIGKGSCDMKTLAIINLKGGVGKSVTAVNLAYLLAKAGKRVLLLDADKQGNASAFFGMQSPDLQTLADVLDGAEIAQTAKHWGDSTLWVVSASMDLLVLEQRLLRSDDLALDKLSARLAAVQKDYDYCLVDCAPALDLAALNALFAADGVLIPTRCDAFSLAGARTILGQLPVMERISGRSKQAHILLTQTQRSKVCTQFFEMLRRDFDKQTLNTTIAASVKVPESLYAKQALAQYAPKSRAARDYDALCGELLNLLECGAA